VSNFNHWIKQKRCTKTLTFPTTPTLALETQYETCIIFTLQLLQKHISKFIYFYILCDSYYVTRITVTYFWLNSNWLSSNWTTKFVQKCSSGYISEKYIMWSYIMAWFWAMYHQ